MKNYLTILFIIIIYSCKAQNGTEFDYNNFESQFLSYEPKQNSQISKTDFDYGNMIIKETKSATKKNPENFSSSDYFNILSAFLTLKESEKNIKLVFQKFEEAEGSCELSLYLKKKIEKNAKYDIIRADYLNKLKECKSKSIGTQQFVIEEYCELNSLNITLVKKINHVDINDQKYRNQSSNEMLDKQKELDLRNQKIINALYKEHKTYIGKSLVGEKFESVMWAVIQHSNIEMISNYLPIIQKAVKEKELNEGPLKMMIDRYYGLTYGYQIFGSQNGFGFELADEKTRKEIKFKYGIE